MKRIFFFLNILLFFFSCEKEVFIVPEPLEKETDPPPEEFEVNVQKVSDNTISMEWDYTIDPEGEDIKYEVSVNDSVLIYDLKYNTYTIENLIPNTEYKIGVNAIDNNFNKKPVFVNVKTKEQLIIEYFHFDLGFYFDYDFTHIIKTNDNGMLISGRKHESYGIQFLLRMDSNFEIQWIKEYDWNYMDYISEIIELNDNNYLIVRKESLTKVDSEGNPIWVFNNENNTTITTINSSYETENGDLIITGTTDINRDSNESINLEAFISKISFSGKLIWHKYFGSTYKNRAEKIIQKPNGNILVAGTATYKFPENRYEEDCLWLIETDLNGNLFIDSILTNNFKGSDIAKEIHIWDGNNILLCGSTHAPMGQHGYYNFTPRFLNLNTENEILWDFYPEITKLGAFPTFDGMISLSSNTFTFFSNLDRGVYLGTVNKSKEITWDLKLRDFPPALFLTYTDSKNIAFFTMNGDLILINPNGYVE